MSTRRWHPAARYCIATALDYRKSGDRTHMRYFALRARFWESTRPQDKQRLSRLADSLALSNGGIF